MYSTICVKRADDHFGFGLTENDPLLKKICVKNDFYIFVPSDLDLRSLNLKFALIVTVVQRYVLTELEVSMTFVFRENRSYGTDGHTDTGVQHLMRFQGRRTI